MSTLTDRLRLPDVVRRRLAEAELDLGAPLPGITARVRNGLEEARLSGTVELRADEEAGVISVEGYAATWGVPYEVAGGPPWGWVETIASGAVDRALSEAPDIRLLVNHDAYSAFGLALARTAADTLTVASDNLGLRTEAAGLDLDDPVVRHVRSALRQRNADQMSWAFRVGRQEWNEDYTERTITEVARIYDVSIVTFPANAATVVGLRADDDPDAETRDERRGMSLALARALVEADRLRLPA